MSISLIQRMVHKLHDVVARVDPPVRQEIMTRNKEET